VSRGGLGHCAAAMLTAVLPCAQALLDFLTKERKCPRCGMKPFTLNPKQVAARSLLYRNQKYDCEIHAWFAEQLGIDLEEQRRMPPNNVAVCLRHVGAYWMFNLGFWTARQWALWLAADCGLDESIGDHSCLWGHQPASTIVLYTLHLAFAFACFAHWTVDALVLRHCAKQVVALQKVTMCGSNWRSETWSYIIVLGIFWAAFLFWSWLTLLEWQ
jgi:hypothetical protein